MLSTQFTISPRTPPCFCWMTTRPCATGSAARWKSFGKTKPKDWKDLTVKNAKRALAISHAGVGSHVTATILVHPKHQLKGGKRK